MGRRCWLTVVVGLACTANPRGPSFGSAGEGSASEDSGAAEGGSEEDTGGGEDGADDGAEGSDDESPPIFDVGGGTDTAGSECEVGGGLDAVIPCDEEAPPDSFDPEVQWAWAGFGDDTNSVVTPLVANLTDDNGDGAVDLCDVPDVVVVAYPCEEGACFSADGHIYVLDGATGELHFRIETAVSPTHTPALGDIDGDGLVEIVTAVDNTLVAFANDGSLEWVSADDSGPSGLYATALADVDADGDVEIIDGRGVFDHNGILVALPPVTDFGNAPTAADLDGDGDLEIILGHSAYHHDGLPYFEIEGAGGFGGGFVQVADLDDDPEPELVLSTYEGLLIAQHDGTVTTPMLSPIAEVEYDRPVTIHDFDGDDVVEIAVKTATQYAVMEIDATLHWSAVVDEWSYGSGGTAFDFLGDGTAEAIYADEQNLHVFDDTGATLLSTPRSSYTAVEYPVVADVDNDGSAEIVVVSNVNQVGVEPAATVQVIRDVDDRWIPARRIWNQHTYHVTNVREDGTIPSPEPPSWKHLNTFRTQAQIQGGTVCEPAG